MTPQDNINDDEQDGSVRTFGVEEELLLVDAVTLSPLPAGDRAVPPPRGGRSGGGPAHRPRPGHPATGAPAPAGDVIAGLLESLRPVLVEYGEEVAVESVVADILRGGSGAWRQREAYSSRHDLGDVVSAALEATHHDGPVPPRAC